MYSMLYMYSMHIYSILIYTYTKYIVQCSKVQFHLFFLIWNIKRQTFPMPEILQIVNMQPTEINFCNSQVFLLHALLLTVYWARVYRWIIATCKMAMGLACWGRATLGFSRLSVHIENNTGGNHGSTLVVSVVYCGCYKSLSSCIYSFMEHLLCNNHWIQWWWEKTNKQIRSLWSLAPIDEINIIMIFNHNYSGQAFKVWIGS